MIFLCLGALASSDIHASLAETREAAETDAVAAWAHREQLERALSQAQGEEHFALLRELAALLTNTSPDHVALARALAEWSERYPDHRDADFYYFQGRAAFWRAEIGSDSEVEDRQAQRLEAHQSYQKALELEPTRVEFWQALNHTAFLLKDEEARLLSLDQLCALDPAASRFMDRALARFVAGQWRAALEDAVAANATDATDSYVQSEFPKFERLQGDPISQLEAWEKEAGDARPDSESVSDSTLDAWQNQLILLLEKDGLAHHQVARARRLAQERPQATLSRMILAQLLRTLGSQQEAQELGVAVVNQASPLTSELARELHAFDTAIAADPGNLEKRYERLLLLHRIWQPQLAWEDAEFFLATENPPARYYVQAAIAQKRLGNLPRAASLCDQAIAQSPRDANALRLAGEIAQDRSLLPQAVEFFERSLAIENSSGTRARLATCLKRLHR